MTVIFYTYAGVNNKLNKTNDLVVVRNTTILKPFEIFDVENPRLIVDYDVTLVPVNYIKVDDYYYFVTTPAYQNGDRLIFELDKDVLMSNLNDLLESEVIISRSSSDYNSYIFDERQKSQVNHTVFSIPIGNSFGFGSSGIILSTISGGGEPTS